MPFEKQKLKIPLPEACILKVFHQMKLLETIDIYLLSQPTSRQKPTDAIHHCSYIKTERNVPLILEVEDYEKQSTLVIMIYFEHGN